MDIVSQFKVQLPSWMKEYLVGFDKSFDTVQGRMDFALELARENIVRNTGGPFAAAIFDESEGHLIAAAVNLVTFSGLSIAHAEVVAISLAQAACESYDLRAASLPPMQLVSTAEPCWMCLGAIHWAGLNSVVSGARDEDVRSIGFDEGQKTGNWINYYKKNGISVTSDVRRKEATDILRYYQSLGRNIYNPALKKEN